MMSFPQISCPLAALTPGAALVHVLFWLLCQTEQLVCDSKVASAFCCNRCPAPCSHATLCPTFSTMEAVAESLSPAMATTRRQPDRQDNCILHTKLTRPIGPCRAI